LSPGFFRQKISKITRLSTPNDIKLRINNIDLFVTKATSMMLMLGRIIVDTIKSRQKVCIMSRQKNTKLIRCNKERIVFDKGIFLSDEFSGCMGETIYQRRLSDIVRSNK